MLLLHRLKHHGFLGAVWAAGCRLVHLEVYHKPDRRSAGLARRAPQQAMLANQGLQALQGRRSLGHRDMCNNQAPQDMCLNQAHQDMCHNQAHQDMCNNQVHQDIISLRHQVLVRPERHRSSRCRRSNRSPRAKPRPLRRLARKEIGPARPLKLCAGTKYL